MFRRKKKREKKECKPGIFSRVVAVLMCCLGSPPAKNKKKGPPKWDDRSRADKHQGRETQADPLPQPSESPASPSNQPSHPSNSPVETAPVHSPDQPPLASERPTASPDKPISPPDPPIHQTSARSPSSLQPPTPLIQSKTSTVQPPTTDTPLSDHTSTAGQPSPIAQPSPILSSTANLPWSSQPAAVIQVEPTAQSSPGKTPIALESSYVHGPIADPLSPIVAPSSPKADKTAAIESPTESRQQGSRSTSQEVPLVRKPGETLLPISDAQNEPRDASTTTLTGSIQESQSAPATISWLSPVRPSVRASIHQSSWPHFTSSWAGSQCTTMAMAGVAMSSIFPVHRWSSGALDVILKVGDSCHGAILASLRRLYENDQRVGLYELSDRYHRVEFGGQAVDIIGDGDTNRFGYMTPDNVRAEPEVSILAPSEAVSLALASTDGVVMTVGLYSMAVLRDGEGRIRVWDSHSRDATGLSVASEAGSAVLLTLDTIEGLDALLQAQLAQQPPSDDAFQFEVTGFRARRPGSC